MVYPYSDNAQSYVPIGDNATPEQGWQPTLSEQQVKQLITFYKRSPSSFTEQKIDEIQKHAIQYNVPFYKGDFSIVGALKDFGKGVISGFTTLDPFDPPDNEYESIARNLGHLVGFAPGILAGPLKMIQAGSLARAASAMSKYSIPMAAANFATRKAKSLVKPILKTAVTGRAGATQTAAKFLTAGKAKHIMEGAFHLGVASGVSSWTHGVDAALHSAYGGALAGGAFRVIGNAVNLGSKTADKAVRTMAGSLFMGLPATMRGATTPEQIYEYLLGGYFGGKEMPWYKAGAHKGMVQLERESVENHELATKKDPRLMKNWNEFEPEVQKELYKMAEKKYGKSKHFSNLDERAAFTEMLLNIRGFAGKDGTPTPEGFEQLSKVIGTDEVLRLSGPNKRLSHGVSGGAEGSDSMWAAEGSDFNVPFVHYTFKGHKTRAKGYHRNLRQSELDEATPKVRKANETLKRGDYDAYRGTVKKLIKRNWFQVKYSDAIYALGNLEKGNTQVKGGTGWAVQMGIDAGKKDIYVYNLSNKKWNKWNPAIRKFEMLDKTPKLKKRFAGIGTSFRRLTTKQQETKTKEARNAIREIYEVTFGKKKAKTTRAPEAKSEKDIPKFTPKTQKEINELFEDKDILEENIYQFNKELKSKNIKKSDKIIYTEQLKKDTKKLTKINAELDAIINDETLRIKDDADSTAIPKDDGNDIGMIGSGEIYKKSEHITNNFLRSTWDKPGWNKANKEVMRANVASVLQETIDTHVRERRGKKLKPDERIVISEFEKNLKDKLDIEYVIDPKLELDGPLRQWLSIRQNGKPVRYLLVDDKGVNIGGDRVLTRAGNKKFVVEPEKLIEKTFKDIGGELKLDEPMYVLFDTITELGKDGFYKDFTLSEYRSDFKGKNAKLKYESKLRKVLYEMREKGYYPLGGKGDADAIYFVKYHPFIENKVPLNNKRHSVQYSKFKRALQSYVKGKDFSKNFFMKKFGLSENEFWKQYSSNLLYDIHMNGFRPEARAEWRDVLKKVVKNEKTSRGDWKYIKNATAFNKRQQVWFTPGWEGDGSHVETSLGETLPLNYANKKSLNYMITNDISKLAKGNVATKQHVDGMIIVRDDVIEALSKDFGATEVASQGQNKSFIISPHAGRGALLGKYMMHSAGEQGTKDMKSKDLHMIMQESAVKQRGERKIGDYFVNDKGMSFEAGTEKYRLPVEDIKYNYSVKQDAHMLADKGIPKQLLTSMTYSAKNPFSRDVIEDFVSETVYKRFTGSDTWNTELNNYLKKPSTAQLRKLTKNIDKIGIDNLINAVKSGKTEFADIAYAEMMKFNRETLQELVAEGEITAEEAKAQNEDLSEYNSFSDKMIKLTAKWVSKERRSGRDGRITPVLLHKDIAGFRTQVVRNYIMHNLSRPKVENSMAARMRGYDKWMQKDLKRLNTDESIFYLDNNFKDRVIHTHIEGIEKIKLGKLWDLYNAKGKSWSHRKDVEEIFRALTVRVPMDSVSGAQVLQFAGFTGRKGHGMLLHGKIMEKEGGADLDGDEAFVFFGGKKEGKGGGFKKKWKDEFHANKDEFDLDKEPHKNASARKALTMQDSKKTTGIDPKSRDSSIWKYNPGWRLSLSERAVEGRNLLGPASNITQLMRNFHSHLLGAPNQADTFEIKFGKQKVTIVRTPKKDTEKARKLAASMVAFSADPLDEAGLTGYTDWFGKLHNSYFNVSVIKNGKLMSPKELAKNKENLTRALHYGLYGDLRDMNKAMFSKNFSNKNNYDSNAGSTYDLRQIKEMTSSTTDINRYGNDDISNTILPKLGALANNIDFADSPFSRIHKESIKPLYKAYNKLAKTLNEKGLKALGRETIGVKYNKYIENIVKYELWSSTELNKIAKSNSKFNDAIRGTWYAKSLGSRELLDDGFNNSANEARRKSILQDLVSMGDKFIVKDFTDMVSGNLAIKYMKGLKPSEVKEIHRKVESLKNESYLMAKQRNLFVQRLNENKIVFEPSIYKALEEFYDAKGAEEFAKTFPFAKGAFKVKSPDISALKDQITIDKEISSFKKGKSKGYKNFFDVMMIGSLRRGNLSKIEALEKKHGKLMLENPAFKDLVRNIKFMNSRTSMSRLGFSSDAVSDNVAMEFLGEFSKTMKKSWEAPKEAKEIIEKELGKEVEGTVFERKIDPLVEGTELEEIYKGFEGLDGNDLSILSREKRQLVTEIDANLQHYGNTTARQLGEIVRGIMGKDMNVMNLHDWKIFNNILTDYKKGTVFQRLFREKTPDLRKRYYWQFPEAVNREMMKYDILWLKKKGFFLNNKGQMVEGDIRKPTHILEAAQNIIGRMNEYSDGMSENLVGNLREELSFVDTHTDGEKLRRFAIAEYELAPEKARIDATPDNQMTRNQKIHAKRNYDDNYRQTKKEANFDVNADKEYRITNKEGKIEIITGRQFVDRVKKVMQKQADKTYELIEGTKEGRKFFKENFILDYYDKGKTEPLVDFGKFIKYTQNKFNKGEGIGVEFGLTNLRHVARSMQIELTSNKELKKKLKSYKIAPIGKITKGYFPHVIQNRKKALKILKAEAKRIMELPEEQMDRKTKVEEVKKILKKSKSITGDWMKGTENWDVFDEAVDAIAKGQKKDIVKWPDAGVVTGSMLSRSVHLPGYSLDASSFEKYIRNQVGAYYRQYSMLMGRQLLQSLNKVAYKNNWHKLKNPGENINFQEKWDRYLRLYLQDAMGNPSIIPQKWIDEPGMKLKGTPYAWWADNKVKEKVNKIAKKLGLTRGQMGTVGKDLESFDENDLRRWSQLEAKFELMSLLAHPKSAVQNVFGGSLHTLQYAGLTYLKKARNIAELQKINPKMKSMQDWDGFVVKHGVLPEFIINELGLTPQARKTNVKAFISDLSKSITQDGTARPEIVNDLQKRHKVGETVTNMAAKFMSVPERMLRRDAFLAQYIKAWERYGGAIKNPDHPFLIEQAKKAVKATQFLYSAPYRPAFARTALGKVMTRFQLWAWNSAKFRNDVFREARQRGFERGTEEFDKFKRTMQIDLMLVALGNIFAFSLFEQSLPAPYNWLQDTSEWLFGDENERNKAFFGNWPTVIAPLQLITPPVARLPVAGLRAFLDDDYSKLSNYYVYTMMPFGRMIRDVSPLAKGNLIDNPTRVVEKMTGFPLGDLARFKNKLQDEEGYYPRSFD